MTVQDSLDKMMKVWARDFAAEHFSPNTQRLISLCWSDLHWGPLEDDGEWSGFSDSCVLIQRDLESLPSTLYVDYETGCWQETEPMGEECDVCEGESADCDVCNGSGWREPCWGDYYRFDRPELKRYLVGRELSEYV